MARLLVDAIQNGDTASAKDIIQTASYGCVDGQSWRRDGTALFFCCSRGYLELATALIAKGADVNATDKSLATPLHGAVDNGHVTIVKLLLEHGATVNSQTSRGDSPLHLSAYRGHQEITQCLVEAGADRGLVNVSNLTAQREAFSRGHTDVSNYLMAIEDATLPEVDHRLHSMIQLDPPNDLDVSTPPGRRQQTKSTVSRCEAKEEARVVKSAPCQQSIAESQRQCHTDESMNEIFLLHDSRQIYLTIDPPAQGCPHTPSASEGHPHTPTSPQVHPHTPSTTTHMYTQDSAKYQVSTRTPTSPQVHPRTPTSPQVQPRTPTSPQVHPHTATSPHVYLHGHKTPWVYPQFPTSPQVYPHTPTSPQVYPHTPTSPQVYPHYPTSPQDYPHYPTSPQPYPHSPTSPQAYPHIPPTAQVNPHRPKLQNSSTQTTWDMSLLSETDSEKQNCQSVNGRCPLFSGHTYLNTRLSSGSVTDISSGSAEADIWSFLSSESETGDCFDIAPRRNSHPYSDSCNKDGFDTGSKEVKNLCEILGVRYPPDHGCVKSPKPSPLTDFSNILEVSLFSLSTLSSAPPSVSPPFYANSLTANHFKNSLKTCRATSVNGPADDSPAARPVFNKSFSVEPRPLRGPRHSLKGSSLHFERLPPNDLSGSYVSVSSIAPKTSSMTCINIPLN